MKSKKDSRISIYSHIGMSATIILVTLFIFSSILNTSLNKQDNNSVIFGIIMLALYILGLCFLKKSFTTFKKLKKLNLESKNLSDLNDISKNIEEFDLLNECFKSYRKSLRPIKDISKDDKVRYCSTLNADYFINDNTIIYNSLKIRTVNSLANSLTGIGILGTFYGLIKGLGGLNSNEIQSGIGVLLDGVNTSFTTSLLGIVLSLSLTFIVKYTIDSISMEISKLVNFINSTVQTSSSIEGFKELENQLTVQTASIQKLATDISEHISNQFANSLTETLKPLFENLDYNMNNLANLNKETFAKFSQTSSETITEMINSSSDLFNSNINQEINSLKESLSLITDKNIELINNINESVMKMESLAKTQENTISNITESVVSITEMKEMFDSINSKLIENCEVFNDYIESQNTSTENMKETLNIALDVTNNQKSISENIVGVQETISNNLSQAVEKYSELIENQEDYLESYSNINEDILESVNSLSEKTEVIDLCIDRQLNVLEEVSKSTQNVMSNLNDSSDLIQYMNTTLNTIASSNTQLNDITSNLGELTLLVKQIARLDEVFNNCANKLDRISENININIEEYENTLDNSTTRVLKKYDSEVSKCIDSLFEITKHLDTMTTGIQDSTYKIAENLKDFKDIVIIEDFIDGEIIDE